ncbi:DUF4064 domain-containing protein [Bacillus atrophaeus]|uniref:DUF4064 domain-containing protein n=1 Tax=Bacillus atrophaeus TaxID=1452 RepID=UPI000D022822|nr:DUF4064 domain-containing protein [Bacillus atrophaeus]MCY8918095.1 DUF4064 domain-containing protein [Bacillus atrophaeus]MCY8923199.1 DUF4064 domain-containing protein [Bacillus atrophaeus]MED1122767.1 DUF4064 domain-containing protein [Bacillus atrophaeus]PRS02331.1 hypothetical protein C6W22_20720 [Bacillus atrophaeus]
MKRTTEFVLGLLGGIFGFIGAIMALVIGGLDASFNSTGTSDIIGLGWGAVFLSILGIVASVIVRKKAKLGGSLLIVSGIGGLICISLFYLLPAVLLIIPGVMGLARKDKTTTTAV